MPTWLSAVALNRSGRRPVESPSTVRERSCKIEILNVFCRLPEILAPYNDELEQWAHFFDVGYYVFPVDP